jgi:hypothetical protein
MQFTLRGRKQRADDSGARHVTTDDPLAGFKELLSVKDFARAEPVIAWAGEKAVEQLAALDVDFHEEPRPAANDIERWFDAAGGYPAFFWVTHGRGVRAIFTARGVFTAEEAAALYYLQLCRVNPCVLIPTGWEIKTDTRHPAYPEPGGSQCGYIHEGKNSDPAVFAKWFLSRWAGVGEVSAEEVDEWLAERGMERGKRYDHTHCPIEPSDGSHDDPVQVKETGIKCYACEGTGRRYAKCQFPGYVPYGLLLDVAHLQRRHNRLADAARGLCHFEHAQHVLAAEYGSLGKHAGTIYWALCKLTHRDALTDPKLEAAARSRIKAVFRTQQRLIRSFGVWVHSPGFGGMTEKGLSKILSALPAVQFIDDAGKLKVCGTTLGFFENNGELDHYGYHSIRPLRGIDLRPPDDLRDDETLTAVTPVHPEPKRYHLDKIDVAEIERHLSANFPGVNLPLLKLLIAAKGIAQAGPSEPPRILLTGQSGSAKTAHVLLAAELACDGVYKAEFTTDLREFKLNVAHGSLERGYIFFDEIAKAGADERELARGILSLTRESSYRELYQGFKALPPLGVIILADTTKPKGVDEEVQLGRRIVYLDLGAGVVGTDWRATCNTGEIARWRSDPRFPKNTRVADMLVSLVRCEYLAMPTTFEKIAEQLGFRVLSKDDTGFDANTVKRELFAAACEHPDTKNGYWTGRGWKVFDPVTGGELAKAFLAAIDDGQPLDSRSWQPLTGAQWGQLLGCSGVALTIKRHGRVIGIRFHLGDPRRSETKFNGDIPISRASHASSSQSHASGLAGGTTDGVAA